MTRRRQVLIATGVLEIVGTAAAPLVAWAMGEATMRATLVLAAIAAMAATKRWLAESPIFSKSTRAHDLRPLPPPKEPQP